MATNDISIKINYPPFRKKILGFCQRYPYIRHFILAEHQKKTFK